MSRRRIVLLLALGVALLTAAWPRPALADCALPNIPCHVDSALYPKLLDIARSLWLIDRGLLLMARWVESLRDWLINGVLGSAFGALAKRVQFPFYLMAAVAWMLLIVGYMLQAIVELNWVNLRKAIRNGAFAILVFTLGSLLITWTENVRVIMGQMMQAVAQESFGPDAGTIQFYAQADTVVAPNEAVYGSSSPTCSGMDTRRSIDVRYLNDYATNFLLADAIDIHCPPAAPGLPVMSGRSQSWVNQYAPRSPVGDNDDNARREAFQRLNDGTWRLIQGFFLVLAAVIEQVMYTLFALALAATWFGLAIALIFALFVPTESLLKTQVDAIFRILKASWLASFWMGAVLALIGAASATRNGLAVVGVGLIALVVTLWQSKNAFSTVVTAANAVSTVAGGAPQAIGGALGGFRSAMTNGALIAGAIATGGVGGLAAMAARQAGRDLAMNSGSGLLGRSAGRVLSNHAAATVSEMAGRARRRKEVAKAANAAAQADQLDTAELAWYESRNYAEAGTPEADARANERIQVLRDQREERMEKLPQPVKERIAEMGPQGATVQRARSLDQQIEEARKRRDFALADKLRAERDRLQTQAAAGQISSQPAAVSQLAADEATATVLPSRPAQSSGTAPSQPRLTPLQQADRRGALLKQAHHGHAARRVARLKQQIAVAQRRGDDVIAARLTAKLEQGQQAVLAGDQQRGRTAVQPTPAASAQPATGTRAATNAPVTPGVQPGAPVAQVTSATNASATIGTSGPVGAQAPLGSGAPATMGVSGRAKDTPETSRASDARRASTQPVVVQPTGMPSTQPGVANGAQGRRAAPVRPGQADIRQSGTSVSPEAIRAANQSAPSTPEAPPQPVAETTVSATGASSVTPVSMSTQEAATPAPARNPVPASPPALIATPTSRPAPQPVAAPTSAPVPVPASVSVQISTPVAAPDQVPSSQPVAAPAASNARPSRPAQPVQPVPVPATPVTTSNAPAPTVRPTQRKWGAASRSTPRLARPRGKVKA